ncbi:MAG: ribonuclease M5 [Bacillus sp. (in: Bacteria)]|nr:ribonuclease M5 [Bacillus sp. (in: firmicutes)]
MRLIVNEVIVVEGKSDTNVIQRYIQCDTIETNGSAVSEAVIARVRLAKERRGVIIFTDPDYPGEKIRLTIDKAVPGCKHAFLPKEAAIDHQKGKVGVEHASEESILDAIGKAKPTSKEKPLQREISREDLMEAGLLGGDGSKHKREILGKILHIGYTNGKQLLKRMEQFQITKEEYLNALQQIEQENENE